MVTIPADINSNLAKAVYLFLEKVGSATFKQLKSALNSSYSELLGVIGVLEERGYVERLSTSSNRVKYTGASSPA